MVATVSALSSSAQAASYYEADDYYADGGVSPSEWQGEGARQLGLSGEVDREVFRELLDGRLPDRQQLGTTRSGKIEHRPGWDVTMSKRCKNAPGSGRLRWHTPTPKWSRRKSWIVA